MAVDRQQSLIELKQSLPTIPDSAIPESTVLKVYTRSAKGEFDRVFPKEQIAAFAEHILDQISRNLFDGENLDYPIVGVVFTRPGTKEYVNRVYDHTTGQQKINRRNKTAKERRTFANQFTFVIRPHTDRRPINIKLFNNSRMTMSGVLRDIDGHTAIDILRMEMLRNTQIFTSLNPDDADQLKINHYSVYMIVADFRVSFPLDREVIRDISMDRYSLFSSYDPDMNYSGVKISFYWNFAAPVKDGVCRCRYDDGTNCIDQERLNPKKRFDGYNGCRCITIAVFQSGCILIQGACCDEQVIDAYEFFKQFIRDNWREIIYISINNQDEIRRILS